MATVYTKQARKSAKGTVYAPGKCELTGTYLIFKLCENYDGQVRGGTRATWRYTDKGLTLDEAKAALEKRVGRKIY